jgi:hypothetical protein
MKKRDTQEIFRNATNIIMYIVFVIYGASILLKWDSLVLQISFGSFMALCLFIAVFYDILRYHNRQAVIAMNFTLDDAIARKHRDFVAKYDFFKSYALNLLILDLHFAQDQQDSQQMNLLLEKGEKRLRRSIDTLLVYYYNMFIMNILLPNKTQARAYYEKFVDLRGVKVKGGKLSEVYNWDAAQAELHLLNGDGKKARACLQNVNLKFMNRREQGYVLYARYRAAKLIGDREGQRKMKEEFKRDYPIEGLIRKMNEGDKQ